MHDQMTLFVQALDGFKDLTGDKSDQEKSKFVLKKLEAIQKDWKQANRGPGSKLFEKWPIYFSIKQNNDKSYSLNFDSDSYKSF
jgi:hypothetical protein